jgi:acetyl esterase/lipase
MVPRISLLISGAELRIRVFNVAYRRQRFPVPLDDAARAVRWVQEYAGQRKVVLGGVSA